VEAERNLARSFTVTAIGVPTSALDETFHEERAPDPSSCSRWAGEPVELERYGATWAPAGLAVGQPAGGVMVERLPRHRPLDSIAPMR
jgi:hypothetical protein